jgi:hypothetical protein
MDVFVLEENIIVQAIVEVVLLVIMVDEICICN